MLINTMQLNKLMLSLVYIYQFFVFDPPHFRILVPSLIVTTTRKIRFNPLFFFKMRVYKYHQTTKLFT